MVSCFISRLVILIFGTLYPAYASYKAVRTKNVREYVKWMMYWIVFALFTCAETFTDLFLSFWFPFYYEIKIITVIYLLSPATKGSSILYRKFVHPVLTKREQEIDEYIAKAKEQGYHTMLNLGSKGVTYATSLIMQTAIKGGGGLVNQLRRSYSLSDLDEEQNLKKANKAYADHLDSSYDEDPSLIRRKLAQSPRRTVSSAGQTGLYFPEVEICQRPVEENYFRPVPSLEEISSGYSSGDPLYCDMQHLKGSHLVRTASLGPSSRVRTRAATKNGLPKRGSLAEGGSSLAALELHESQNETDIHLNFPLSHSATFPFPYASFQQTILPEYHQMFKNFTHNQMFAFINQSEFSQPVSNIPVVSENLPWRVLKSEINEESNNSVLSIENNSPDFKKQTLEDNYFNENFPNSKVTGNNEVIKINKEIVVIEEAQKNTEKNINAEKTNGNDEDPKEKSQFQERSGKYNKKPAPAPSIKNLVSTTSLGLSAEDEEAEFFTPSQSPKLARKHDLADVNLTAEKKNIDLNIENRNLTENNFSLTTKKPKLKSKKGEFNISKKLHMPKMTFSFWHQKGAKQALASESCSLASDEILIEKTNNKDNLEYFIPLKENDNKNN